MKKKFKEGKMSYDEFEKTNVLEKKLTDIKVQI
jgi:hypothetical protein